MKIRSKSIVPPPVEDLPIRWPQLPAELAPNASSNQANGLPAGESLAPADLHVPLGCLAVRTDDEPRGTEKRAGWLVSLIIHGVIVLVIALLVAPADFGGASTISLVFGADQESSQSTDWELASDSMAFDINAADSGAENAQLDSSSMLQDAMAIETFVEPISFAAGRHAGGSMPGFASPAAGPQGSFFGIEATGHDFVYVIDRSGSMEGERLARAKAELIRSVSNLRPDQRFYVVMFATSSTRMMHDRSLQSSPIPATRENRVKLAKWLDSIDSGGGTDPREAIQFALKMRPSAVFMLSDGEFKEERSKAKQVLFGDNADTYSIVQARAAGVPVHSIAFDDKASCRNMKRLAEMTDGDYRFTDLGENDIDLQAALNFAKYCQQQKDYATASIIMGDLIGSLAEDSSSDDLRLELATMLFDQAQARVRQVKSAGGDDSTRLKITLDCLGELMRLDTVGFKSKACQTELLGSMDRLLPQFDVAQQHFYRMKAWSLAVEHPEAFAGAEILAPFNKQVMDEARSLVKVGQPMIALQRITRMLSQSKDGPQATEAIELQTQISTKLLSEAESLAGDEQYVQATKIYQGLFVRFRTIPLGVESRKRLEALLRRVVLQSQRETDPIRTLELKKVITRMCFWSEHLQSEHALFERNEKLASRLFVQYTRMVSLRRNKQAEALADSILKKYPQSSIAQKLLDGKPDGVDEPVASEDDSVLVNEMFQDLP